MPLVFVHNVCELDFYLRIAVTVILSPKNFASKATWKESRHAFFARESREINLKSG